MFGGRPTRLWAGPTFWGNYSAAGSLGGKYRVVHI
jgi:hypothetical protein